MGGLTALALNFLKSKILEGGLQGLNHCNNLHAAIALASFTPTTSGEAPRGSTRAWVHSNIAL